MIAAAKYQTLPNIALFGSQGLVGSALFNKTANLKEKTNQQ